MAFLRIVPLLAFAAILAHGQSAPSLTTIDPRFHKDIERLTSRQSAAGRLAFFKESGGEYVTDAVVHAGSADEARRLGITPRTIHDGFFTARMTFAQMEALSRSPSVRYIEAPRILRPRLNKSLVDMKVDKLHAGQVGSTVYKGDGVIVGVIDSGIDWKHLDFRSDTDTTKSRILFLLDQTTAQEFTKAQIDNELDGTPAGIVTEQDLSGHGTHVAGVAAGDGSVSGGTYTGVAPKADLIVVKAGDDGFSTTNIIDGMAYIRQKAASVGKPYVINMSLGGHDGPHDGTSTEEVALDAETATGAGRQIVVAAGNEGSDAIHAGATLSQGASTVIKINVPAYTPAAGSVNDIIYMTMWYRNGDNFTVSVKTPNNTVVQAATGGSQTNASANGFVRVVNSSSSVNSKGARECYIEIYDNDAAKPPTADTSWTITITAGTVPQGGTFDLWLAGSTISGAGGAPVQFTSGHTFAKLVGIPGTAESGITVGSYVTKWSWTNVSGSTFSYNGTDRTDNFSTFSSMGPTRDGRQKPDVSAPGQAIGAPRASTASFSSAVLLAPSSRYVIEQGTSMAAPHVAGLIALMLQANPALTGTQIRTKLTATARKDANTGAAATAQWGHGKVDAQAAMQSVLSVRRVDGTVPSGFSLAQNHPNPFNPSTTIEFTLAMRARTALKVYNVLGAELATLADAEMDAGRYSVPFDASGLASGVYLYVLTSGGSMSVGRMTLLR